MTVIRGGELPYQDRPARRVADPFPDADGSSSARQVVLDPVERRSPHLHPHSEEVVYVVEGSGKVWIEGVTHRVEPGTWVRIPAGTPHATLANEHMLLVCFFPHHDLSENTEELDLVLDAEGRETK